MNKLQLSVEDSLAVARDQSYWDGFAAGVASAADHAKRLSIQKIIDAKQSAPAQPDPAPEA